MKVIAIKDGYYKKLRNPGDEPFDWPELDEEGVKIPPWVKPVESAQEPETAADGAAGKEGAGASAPAALPEALSDGTRLDSFADRQAIRAYGEATFGNPLTWASTADMLAELVALDGAAGKEG